MARIKTNGAELKKFWSDNNPQFWPVTAHVDGMTWQVNGEEHEDVDVEKLSDADVVHIEGAIIWDDGDADFAGVMRRWRKLETHVSVVVELPVEHKDALAEFVKSLKGKVLGA